MHVGLVHHDPARCYRGDTLCATRLEGDYYLVGMQGEPIHRWPTFSIGLTH